MRKPELESRADEMLEDADFDAADLKDADALDEDGDRTP
jgi:hypothetical protein